MNTTGIATDITVTSPPANGSTSINHTSECDPVFRPDNIVYVVLVVIEVLWNFLILLAVIMGRKRLQHNLVYSYVRSVVSANIALGVLMGYTILVGLLRFERPIDASNSQNDSYPFDFDPQRQSHRSLMLWWAFRRALIIALFLVMSGSVMSLIQGIADSAMFVGRSGSVRVKLNLKRMKRKVTIMISLTWVIPFIYTWLVFGWNCVDQCNCLPAHYEREQDCLLESDPQKCSYVWSPMTNGYLLLAVAIWVCQCVAIFVLLFRTFAQYKSTMKPPILSAKDASSTNALDNSSDNYHQASTEIHLSTFKKDAPPLHPTIKLLIALSISYTVCTAPIIICFMIDAFNPQRFAVSYTAVKFSSAFVFVYCFACPAFLIAYMPGLRSAVVRLIHSCSLTTTTVVDKKASITTVSRS